MSDRHIYSCAECGQPMIVGPDRAEWSGDVTHHLTPDGEIDYDQDEDHVAYRDPESFFV